MVNTKFDSCVSFHINNNAFFGRFVRLDNVINTILSKHQYPKVVSSVLAESIALAALLASTLKYEGLFTLQTKSNGPINMIVIDISSDGTIRASASYDEQRIENAKKLRKTEDEHEEAPHYLGQGYLAFTVDQGGTDKMYQGVVEIQGKTLSECALRYFKQSEQIDTALKLYVKEPEYPEDKWQSAGILLQKLPNEGGTEINENEVKDSWEEAVIFLESLQPQEIFDSNLSSEVLLHRLYHSHQLSVSHNKDYKFGCRCNREKLRTILSNMSEKEIDSLSEKGKITAECSFCGEKYSFEKGELIKQ